MVAAGAGKQQRVLEYPDPVEFVVAGHICERDERIAGEPRFYSEREKRDQLPD